jgi:hypothetical protein
MPRARRAARPFFNLRPSRPIVTSEGKMGMKDATWGGGLTSWDEGSVQSRGVGPRERFRRQLAGMAYEQQVEAVRPPAPVQRQAVQFSGDAEPAAGNAETSDDDRRAPELDRRVSGIARHVADVVGEEAWRTITTARSRGATDEETIIALIEALTYPTLHHKGPEAGRQRETADGRTQTASDCQYTTWLIVEAVRVFEIPVAFEERSFRHAAPWFPSISRGLWDGDDLYFHPRQVDAVTSAEELLLTREEIETWDELVANEPWRIRDELESQLEGHENPDMERLLRWAAERSLVFAVPCWPRGLGDAVFHSALALEVVEAVRPELLSALPPEAAVDILVGLVRSDLERLPRLLPRRAGFPELEPLFERLLPNGQLPADREGAIGLAARLFELRVTYQAALDTFFDRHLHPAYRQGDE